MWLCWCVVVLCGCVLFFVLLCCFLWGGVHRVLRGVVRRRRELCIGVRSGFVLFCVLLCGVIAVGVIAVWGGLGLSAGYGSELS